MNSSAFCSHVSVRPSLQHAQRHQCLRQRKPILQTQQRRSPLCLKRAPTTNEPHQKKEGDLILTKRTLQCDIMQRPSSSYMMTCQASQLELEEDELVGKLSIAVIVYPVRRHFRLRGLVTGTLHLACDRCLKEYQTTSNGTFEVWLSATGPQQVSGLTDQQMQSLEAIEDFSSPESAVDLAPHIRDAVLLSTPTKKLCSLSCSGIKPSGEGVAVFYGEEAAKVPPMKDGHGLFDAVPSEKLASLRRKLES